MTQNMDLYLEQISKDTPEDSKRLMEGNSGWICFHRGRRYEVSASSADDAKEQAVKLAKANNKNMDITTSDITVKHNEDLQEGVLTKNSGSLRKTDFIKAFVNIDNDATFLLDSAKNGSPKTIITERINGKQKVTIRDY